jgi:RHS repeat-associated protein
VGAWQSFYCDSRNRQTWFSWNDGTQSQLTVFDVASRITSLQNVNADITLTYDNANRKTSETENIKSYSLYAQRSTVYQYDDDGNRSRLVYPQGYQFIYGYTQRAQLDNIKLDPAIFGGTYNTPVARYTYDLSGNRTTRTVLSGAHAEYEIDDLNRVGGQWNYFSGSTGRFDYGFDAMGRRRYERRDFGPTDGYQYDPSDELTDFKRDGTLNGDGAVSASGLNTTDLQYDNNGNRTQLTGNGANSYAINNLNQYTWNANSGAMVYDAKGNLYAADSWIYSYDAQNRLTMIQGNGLTISMTYDPLNRVITRNVNGAVTQNVWDGWNLIEEHRPDWSLQRCYLYGANQNEMVAAFDGGIYGNHWYWQDGRGNTSHITGDNAALFERYTYDLSGAPRFYDPNGSEGLASAYDTRFLFAGRQYLPDTGLYDMRNRVYHIGLNRFLQTDPVGLQIAGAKPSVQAAAFFWAGKAPETFASTELNLYRYCGNDPVDESDPLGLEFHDKEFEEKDSILGKFGNTEFKISVGLGVVSAGDGTFSLQVRQYNVAVKSKEFATHANGHLRSPKAIEATKEHENLHVTHARAIHDANQNRVIKTGLTQNEAESIRVKEQRNLADQFYAAASRDQQECKRAEGDWLSIVERERKK